MEKAKKTKSDKGWKIFAIILFILEIVAVSVAILQIVFLNMLPTRYLVVAGVMILLLVIITGLFLFIKGHSAVLKNLRRVIGVIISLAIIITCSAGAYFVGKINHTVSSITTETTTSNVLGVYVMKTNQAQAITDAKEFKFAVSQQFDYDNTVLALSDINKELGTSVTTVA